MRTHEGAINTATLTKVKSAEFQVNIYKREETIWQDNVNFSRIDVGTGWNGPNLRVDEDTAGLMIGPVSASCK